MAPRAVRRLSRMLGTPPDNTPKGILKNTKSEDVLRCVKLLEHVGQCQSERGAPCVGREACCRGRRVLLHHRYCVLSLTGGECVVCHQLRVLCLQHSTHCAAGPGQCYLPHCHNEVPEQCEQRRRLINDYSRPLEPSSEKYREVSEKVKAARLAPSEVEKRKRLMDLLNEDPRAVKHYLRNEGATRDLRTTPYCRPAPLSASSNNSSYSETLSQLSVLLKIMLL